MCVDFGRLTNLFCNLITSDSVNTKGKGNGLVVVCTRDVKITASVHQCIQTYFFPSTDFYYCSKKIDSCCFVKV